MDETRIADLLRSNVRDHELTEAERGRIRSRLGIGENALLVDVNASVELPLRNEPAAAEPRTPRRKVRFLVTAAVAAVVIGLAVFAPGGNQSTDSVVVGSEDGDRPSEELTEERFCGGSFLDLTDAFETWGGLGRWARLTDDRNPEPHLPALTATVVGDLERLVGDAPKLSQAQSDLEALLDSIATDGPTPTAQSDRSKRLQLVADVLGDRINAEQAEGRFRSCDVDALVSAVNAT
jgi:hypothetical protein